MKYTLHGEFAGFCLFGKTLKLLLRHVDLIAEVVFNFNLFGRFGFVVHVGRWATVLADMAETHQEFPSIVTTFEHSITSFKCLEGIIA